MPQISGTGLNRGVPWDFKSAAGLCASPDAGVEGVAVPGVGLDDGLGDGLGEGFDEGFDEGFGDGLGEGLGDGLPSCAGGAGSSGRPGNAPPGSGVEEGGGLGCPDDSPDGFLGINNPSGGTIRPASGGCVVPSNDGGNCCGSAAFGGGTSSRPCGVGITSLPMPADWFDRDVVRRAIAAISWKNGPRY